MIFLMSELKGYISQIIGPVVDVHFNLGEDDAAKLPAIHEALSIIRSDGRELIVEVQQHIGDDTVRTVAMDRTAGLSRGMEVVATGQPITMLTTPWWGDACLPPPNFSHSPQRFPSGSQVK